MSLPRLAALALTVLLAPSCLVTSIDSFPDPPSTAPFLNGSLASPPIAQIVLVDNPATSDPITFSSYVRSEDAGFELQANLVADWPGGATIGSTRLGAGAFSDQRLLSFTWDPKRDDSTLSGSVSEGCHSFTLIVTHQFNFNSSIPAFMADSDSIVWWVFVGKPGGLNSFDLSRCATSTQLPAPTPTATATTTTAPVSP